MPPAEDVLPGIISQLREGNWVAGTEAYFEYQIQKIKESNFITLTEEQENEFARGIEELVAKYGLVYFGPMLLRRLNHEYITFADPKSPWRGIFPPDPERNALDWEFNSFVNKFMRLPAPYPPVPKVKTHAETMAELEAMKLTCSIGEYEDIVAMQELFSRWNFNVRTRENAFSAFKNVEKDGMRKCWDQTVEVFVFIREPDTADQLKLAAMRKIVASRLDDMIARFGFAAVEDQVRKRLRGLFEEFDPTVAYFRPMDINCPPELEKAIHKLFRD